MAGFLNVILLLLVSQLTTSVRLIKRRTRLNDKNNKSTSNDEVEHIESSHAFGDSTGKQQHLDLDLGAQGQQTDADLAALGEDFLSLVNKYRAAEQRDKTSTKNTDLKYSLKPFTQNTDLDEVAKLHAEEMIQRDYFDHIGLDGRGAAQRSMDHGCAPASEVIAYGATAQDAVSSFKTSEAHWDLLMNAKTGNEPPFTPQLGYGSATHNGVTKHVAMTSGGCGNCKRHRC